MQRVLKVCIGIIFLAACAPARDSASEGYVIGVVNPVAMREPVVQAFKTGMAELGYVEGRNVRYMDPGAIPDPVARAAWVQTLVEADVDLLIGIATPGAISAKAGTEDIPIIFFPVTDPVGSGLVDSLQTPGSNATGVTNGNPHPLRLQLLLELDPTIEVIYAPYDADSPPALATLPSLEQAASELGVELMLLPVRTTEEIEQAIRNIPEEVDAIFNLPDPRVANRWPDWMRAAIARGIPYSSLSYAEVEGGVLMAYGEELDSVGRQAARMADAVLRGVSPADIPVETSEFFLSLNLATAAEMGLTVPDRVLHRATYIIYPAAEEAR
ncbi:MAG: ABC transporter substrate-binding protein [Chloroflexota bacterium]